MRCRIGDGTPLQCNNAFMGDPANPVFRDELELGLEGCYCVPFRMASWTSLCRKNQTKWSSRDQSLCLSSPRMPPLCGRGDTLHCE